MGKVRAAQEKPRPHSAGVDCDTITVGPDKIPDDTQARGERGRKLATAMRELLKTEAKSRSNSRVPRSETRYRGINRCRINLVETAKVSAQPRAFGFGCQSVGREIDARDIFQSVRDIENKRRRSGSCNRAAIRGRFASCPTTFLTTTIVAAIRRSATSLQSSLNPNNYCADLMSSTLHET